MQYPGAGVARELRRLLCWVPAKRFGAAMLRVACMAWNWVLAAGTPELQVRAWWGAARTGRQGLQPGQSLSKVASKLRSGVHTRVCVAPRAMHPWHHATPSLSARQVALLTEIADAFSYTVRARMGLWARHATRRHAAAPAANGGANGSVAGGAAAGEHRHEDPAAAVDAIAAHHLWISFLWEVRCPLWVPRPD